MDKKRNAILSVAITIVVFIGLSLVYFYPVIQGQKLLQPDIVNFVGGAKEANDFRATHDGAETYWINSMFSGMPTYQFGAQYKYDFIGYVDQALNFLPRPASYLFLMMLSFAILLRSLSFDWRLSILGAILYAFSTYFFIALAAGHNAKIHALVYIPGTIAGILLIYQKKYGIGALVAIIFMALQIKANHLQMTYYMGIALLIYGIVEAIQAYKEKEIKPFLIASVLAVSCLLIGLGMNANRLLPTYEYAAYSNRAASELSTEQSINDSGMKWDNIMSWSYGKFELLNLWLPNLYGGSSSEVIEYNNQAVARNYWGDQPFTSGPAYQGSVVIFLFVLGLFVVRGKYKWWLLVTVLVSMLFSVGKNMEFVNRLVVAYLPMYSKFRAVTSSLVLVDLCVPILAVMTIKTYWTSAGEQMDKYNMKRLWMVLVGFIAVGVLLLFSHAFLNLLHASENKLPQNIQEHLKAQRLQWIRMDVLKALLYILITAGALFFIQRQQGNSKKQTAAIFLITIVGLFDLWMVNKRYLNEQHFVKAHYVENPYPTKFTTKMERDLIEHPQLQTIVGQEIVPNHYSLLMLNEKLKKIKLSDTTHYRVLNKVLSPMSEAHTSYFHRSIGGYHAVKLRRYQELYDYHISKNNQTVLNMLNTKYIISVNPAPDSVENVFVVNQNTEANGNAWFVDRILWIENPDQEIEALNKVDTKSVAICNIEYKSKLTDSYQDHSTDQITLEADASNRLKYKIKTKTTQLVVFSEIAYPGWQAYIDGQQAEHVQANYVLRAMEIPPGEHIVEFIFEPSIMKVSSRITLAFYVIFMLIIAVVLFPFNKWKRHA